MNPKVVTIQGLWEQRIRQIILITQSSPAEENLNPRIQVIQLQSQEHLVANLLREHNWWVMPIWLGYKSPSACHRQDRRLLP